MRALITGITGQDGSHLADLLVEKNYEVFGTVRRTSVDGNTRYWRIAHLLGKIELIEADLLDQSSLEQALLISKPDEIYSLAADSFVQSSFKMPAHTMSVTGLGPARLFEAARIICPEAKILQASSSEMFGISPPPQNEQTAFKPRSPYAISKVMAHQLASLYRDAYRMFIACSISFNHEGERRSLEFVTRKITHAVAQIKAGLQHELMLGNIESKRDFGYAPEYVNGMWKILQQDIPDDYVLATGETHSVKEFLDLAFTELELDWEDYVKFDEAHLRPAEVPLLQGDASKAKAVLGWEPQVRFPELVKLMVEADAERVLQAIGEK